ncbi:hypothetical protein [Spirosoma taeanense]|nr:hypothetical protein [Spirosoma taeanense]
MHGEYQHRVSPATAICPGNTDTGFQTEANADSSETVARPRTKTA